MKTQENISAIRLKWIKAHTRYSAVKSKDDALENLDDGLKMIDFDVLRTEIQSLSSNINARDEDLKKFKKKIFSDTQKLAHYWEKHSTSFDDIEDQKDDLYQVRMEENIFIRRLNRSTLRKEVFRLEQESLLEKGGLVHKPNLLRDYDRCEDYIHLMTEKMNQGMKKNQGMKTKIAKMSGALIEKELERTKSEILNEILDKKMQKHRLSIVPWIKRGIKQMGNSRF